MSEPTVSPTAAFSTALNNANAGGGENTPPANAAPVDSGQQTQAPATQPSGQPSGGHPAWNEILSVVPPSLHDQVRPTLEKWDQGVQAKLEQVHSQYSPYKGFVENKVPVESIQAGLQLFQILNSDPRRLYDELANFLGITPSGQGQPQQQQNNGVQDLGEFGDPQQTQYNLEKDPRFQQLAAQQQQMQQMLAMQAQEQQAKQANDWLENRLGQVHNDFKTKHNFDPDMGYILGVATGKINSGTDPDVALTEAVNQYEKAIQQIRSIPVANNSAPPVLAPNGSVPSQQFNPAQMSDDARKKLMGEMLSQAFKE